MKTTSPELSQALKKAGADALAAMYWVKVLGEIRLCSAKNLSFLDNEDELICPAFDCHELLERLPDIVELHKLGSTWYQFGYEGFDSEMYKTPAEALGKLYLWCLENGHCSE